MPRRRLRKFILITGTLLCVLIAAAFVVSVWWYPWVGSAKHFIAVYCGAFEYYYQRPHTGVAGFMRHAAGLRFALVAKTWPGGDGFTLGLVYPFAAVAVPTLLVWRFWPKPVKPGHCRCGYDLQGNVSGKCPECGVEVRQ